MLSLPRYWQGGENVRPKNRTSMRGKEEVNLNTCIQKWFSKVFKIANSKRKRRVYYLICKSKESTIERLLLRRPVNEKVCEKSDKTTWRFLVNKCHSRHYTTHVEQKAQSYSSRGREARARVIRRRSSKAKLSNTPSVPVYIARRQRRNSAWLTNWGVLGLCTAKTHSRQAVSRDSRSFSRRRYVASGYRMRGGSSVVRGIARLASATRKRSVGTSVLWANSSPRGDSSTQRGSSLTGMYKGLFSSQMLPKNTQMSIRICSLELESKQENEHERVLCHGNHYLHVALQPYPFQVKTPFRRNLLLRLAGAPTGTGAVAVLRWTAPRRGATVGAGAFTGESGFSGEGWPRRLVHRSRTAGAADGPGASSGGGAAASGSATGSAATIGSGISGDSGCSSSGASSSDELWVPSWFSRWRRARASSGEKPAIWNCADVRWFILISGWLAMMARMYSARSIRSEGICWVRAD